MKILFRFIILISSACLFVLSGCAEKSEENLLVQARSDLEKKDRKSAVVDLKTLLQKNPASGEARYLIGKTLFEEGDVAAAIIELQKARELNYSEAAVAPALAKAWLAQGKNKELIAEFGGLVLADTNAAAELSSTVAFAYLKLGDNKQAERKLTMALAAVPQYPPAVLAQARLKAVSDDIDGALRLVEIVTTAEPINAEAWRLKGHFLLYGKSNADAALEAYRKSLAIDAAGLASNIAVIDLLLARQDIVAARSQLSELKKLLPQHPITRFMEARFMVVDRDYKGGRTILQELLRLAPENPQFLLLGALVEFELNSLIQAETYLNKLLQGAPANAGARRLLAQVHLRSGDPGKALNDLGPNLLRDPPDAETLSLAGEAHLQAGDIKSAEALFANAVKSRPSDPRMRTALALTQLSRGNSEASFVELTAISSADAGAVADMAMIAVRVRRGEFDLALKSIDILQRKQPDKPLAEYLRGRVLLQKKQTGTARASFERALVIDSIFFPATVALVAIDIADGKIDDARQRLEAVLKLQPNNAPALLAMAELRQRQGASREEIVKLLMEATRASPLDPTPRLLLVESHLAARDFKQALIAAQEANAALPDRPELLEVLGRTQMAYGDLNQSISTFTRLVSLQPKSARPHMLLASARTAAKSYDSAAQSFRRALEISPGLVEAQRGLIALALQAKKPQEAILVARAIQQQRPNQAVGYLFEGEIEIRRRNWDAAAVALRIGSKKSDVGILPARLHFVLLEGRKSDDAEKFATGWLNEHPKDISFLSYLGDTALARRDYQRAEQYYRLIAVLEPNNALAQNNVAWSMHVQEKVGALPFAERALVLAPNSPPFLDTLVWVLADDKQIAKAVEAAKLAVSLAPRQANHQLTLAKMYIMAGEKSLAKIELDKLQKMGVNFSAQSEVGQLLVTLEER